MFKTLGRSDSLGRRSVRIVAACAIAVAIGWGTGARATPYFLIDSESEWRDALASGRVEPMAPTQWSNYMQQWSMFLSEGDPYPPNVFVPPILPQGELYVYGGGGGGGVYPEDAGLVMVWQPQLSGGQYSSAWKYDYGLDPDLSNCTISVTVTAPQFDALGSQINVVSFGIMDAAGAIRSWFWNCGPAGPIPWNVPTPITINTALVGLGAATPPANGYANNPAFNIVNSMSFIVDENAVWVGGPMPVPPPGAQIPAGLWNYWHNILVAPNPGPKIPMPTKWSQPVVEYIPGHQPPLFLGWDERSLYYQRPVLADDWECRTDLPVTDIHWWGSFLNWSQPVPPPQLPQAFHIAIWTDVPAGGTAFSHPGQCIWQTFCTEYTWNFAGYDHDPRGIMQNEACFQFNQVLRPEEWFRQPPSPEPKIYWLSIAAIYEGTPQYPWGWKTRPHFFQDDAVRITNVTPAWPPVIGSAWVSGSPVQYPTGTSWDLAFELTTQETGPSMDFGDAPEGALAYPASGIVGQYPTCMNVGPAGWVQHTNFGAYFGPMVDLEPDGNGGLCPAFNPYDNDECWGDGDAGLLHPPAYTIQGGAVVPCAGEAAPIGQVCRTAAWGPNLDIHVVNNMPNQTVGYVNVLMDWDQDGKWGGASSCPTGAAPEHVLVNFPVPPGFAGPLSALGPPGFLIGPNAGHVWTRFTISEVMVPNDWDGAGSFEDGETEDYLLAVDPAQPDQYDFGDAPDPKYPTLLANNGAQHVIWTGFFLGAQIDAEPNGQPNPTATGDDINNLADEDGVTFHTALFSGVPNTITVTATLPPFMPGLAYLNAWIDLNGDGDWADAGEQVITDYVVANGANAITFVPGAITATGSTFARFRLSTQVGLSYTGLAPDGEVEDYRIGVVPVKWLQRPDVNPTGVDVDNFWVQLADDFMCTQSGPITDIHLWGSFVGDYLPPQGLNSLVFTLSIYSDVPAGPDNPYSHPGHLLWSRTYGPGSYGVGLCTTTSGEWWHDPATNSWHFPGDTQIYQFDFVVPEAEAFRQREGTTYWLGVKYANEFPTEATFGWKSSLEHWNDDACWLDTNADPPVWRELRYGDGHPMGMPPGISMDLAFAITGVPGPVPDPDDFGDAPKPYPTLLADGGARHTVMPGFNLGNLADTEPNGQPNATATGDDLNNLADEDGVTFNGAMFSGVPNTITVTATILPGVTAYLNAWIDFNGDGDWADAGEQILVDRGIAGGVNSYTIVPPNITALGQTFARFRLSTQKGLSYTGAAPDGEVEDYRIEVVPVKWLQRPDVRTTGVDVDNHFVQLADDFKCTQTGPITDIHLWTSFADNILPPTGIGSLTFTLFIYSDVPAGPGLYSHPGELLWRKTFVPGTYTASLCANVEGEWWFDPATNFWKFPGDTQIYQYDFYIKKSEAFWQTKGTIYWLGLKYNEQEPGQCTLGWKTSLEHWNDDACWLDPRGPVPTWRELRYGDGHPMAPQSIDLAFALTTYKSCHKPPQDADGDGDVDLTDFAQFQACFNGPNRPWPPTADPLICTCFDDDADSDVDLVDFGVFQTCFNGPNRPPGC